MSPLRKLTPPPTDDLDEAPETLRSARLEAALAAVAGGDERRATLLPPPPSSDPLVVERSGLMPAAHRRDTPMLDDHDTAEWLDDSLLLEEPGDEPIVIDESLLEITDDRATDRVGDGRCDTDPCDADPCDTDRCFTGPCFDDDPEGDRLTLELYQAFAPPTLRSAG